MSVAIPSLRGAIAVPGWAKNELWRKARAVPSLDLRFADSKSLVDATTGQSLITFTRASSGTFVGSDGVIATASTNVPRFDHNPTTGESLGLLVEEQRTNLLLLSEEFDDMGWTKTRSTVTANAATSPAGTVTADKLIEDSSTNTHFVEQFISVASGISYTQSVYAKLAEREYVTVLMGGAGFIALSAARFDLSTGTATVTNGTPTASINSVGNGWYRCSITSVATASGAEVFQIRTNNGSTTLYTGDGTSGIFLWGAQLEAGAFSTSYIKTEAAAATRSADIASITGTNFSGWYRQDEGTVFAEGRSPSTVRVLTAIDDGSMSNRFQVTIAGSYTPNFAAVSGGGVSADIYTAALPQGSLASIAAAYKVNDFALSSNGSNVSTDTVGALPVSPSVVRLGVFQNGSGYLNGTIRRLTYWPVRLGNNVLQQVTQ